MADIFDLFKKIESKATTANGKPEFIIVGLGNPGVEYERTRHNAGFLAVDRVAEKCGVQIRQGKYKALIASASIGGHSVLLMKPQTYMNLSGEAVKEAASFYQIPADHVIVISDDVCQAPGRMRIRKSGSAGGQKGLANIINHLGTDAVPRIRIGVGEKPSPEYDLASWVLGKMPEAENQAFFDILPAVYDASVLCVRGEIEAAMCRFSH